MKKPVIIILLIILAAFGLVFLAEWLDSRS